MTMMMQRKVQSLRIMDYTEVARIVLEGVGGKENIESIDNCITRLRLEIRDYTKVDEKDQICRCGRCGSPKPEKNSTGHYRYPGTVCG